MKNFDFLEKIEGAIFDLDGTMFDSTWVWDKVDIDFLGARGFDVPEDYVEAISPLGAENAAVYTIERFGLNEKVEDIVQEWFDMAIREYATEVQCKPYVYEFVKELSERGVKLAIATSSDKVLFEETLKRTGLNEFFDIQVMVKEVARGKEFPDIYLEAASRIGVAPEKCVVFEDILPAIKGAKSGNFITVGVYEERSVKDENEMIKEADYYIKSFKELL